MTFFAPPDRALRSPGRKLRADHNAALSDLGWQSVDDLLRQYSGEELFPALVAAVDELSMDGPNDMIVDDKRHKIIKKIITAVLSYHIMPTKLAFSDLAKNITFPTSLKLGGGTLGSHPLRLRVEQPPRILFPSLKLNFYAIVVHGDIFANNGTI